MSARTRFVPEPTSAPGDFYVENRCCAACGVPLSVAPDLVGWVDDNRKMPHCRWKKQPSTQEELERAFAIFDAQELGCHRYAGTDLAIQQRIGFENCDYPLNRSGRDEGRNVSEQSATRKRRPAIWSKAWRRKRRDSIELDPGTLPCRRPRRPPHRKFLSAGNRREVSSCEHFHK